MKHLKFMFILTLSACFACVSCQNSGNNNTSDSKSGFAFSTSRVKTHEYKDGKTGIVVSQSDFPSDWEVMSRPLYEIDPEIPTFQYQIQGPSNLRIFNSPVKMNYSAQNPQYGQQLQAYGVKNVRPMASPETIIEYEIQPKMKTHNYAFKSNHALEDLERYFVQKAKQQSPQLQVSLKGTEWSDGHGGKAVSILYYITQQHVLYPQELVTVWFYSTDFLFADEDKFDEMLAKYVKSTIEQKENPNWKNRVMQLQQQRQAVQHQQQQQSLANHRNRMAQRQASFNAHQQNMKGNSDAMDANHNSFMNRNFGSSSNTSGYSGGQQGVINMINEEETVTHSNGTSYQVEAGGKDYWMDSQGNYVKSNDLFYNPNGDINLNNAEWQKVK